MLVKLRNYVSNNLLNVCHVHSSYFYYYLLILFIICMLPIIMHNLSKELYNYQVYHLLPQCKYYYIKLLKMKKKCCKNCLKLDSISQR